jgi:RND superfamily putative drug exporter
MLERWTRAVIRWRVVVISLWVVAVVLGVVAAGRLPELLSTSLAVPGTASQQADVILAQHFQESIEGAFTVVFRVSNPSAAELRALDAKFAAAARTLPTATAMPLRPVSGIVYGNINTSLDLQQAAVATADLRRALQRSGLPTAYVTGAPALQHDITPILAADLRRGELLAVVIALILLSLVLGVSVALLLPLLVAACTTLAALAVVFLLAHRFLMVLYVPNLVQLIGLGLAVDYCLLIVHRFKEELEDAQLSDTDAIVTTMATAGRAVIVSGAAVAIGLSVLLIIPVPFVRSLGFAGLVVPVISIAAALTLQPALLSVLGRRATMSFGSLKRARRERTPWWSMLAGAVMRRPVVVLAGSTALLVGLAAPALWLQLTPGSVVAIPQNLPSGKALALLGDRVGPGVITPIEVVLDAGAPGKARAQAVSDGSLRLARELLRDPEVFVVAIGSRAPYVDSTGRYSRVFVVPRHDFGDEATQHLVGRVRSRYLPAAHFPPGVRVYVGGAPAQGVDFLARVYGAFPWIVLLILALAYLVLLRAFRSVLLPLIAIVLDAISVAAAYGLLVVVFRFGVGAKVFGLYRVSQIEGWVPVFLFAMLFGLSMDYEVFFVTRMRESWDACGDNRRAVTDGLTHTGGVVSAAALIMVGALSGLVAGHVAGLQELGVGLGLGVLLDATFVRGLLLPSLMSLLGSWNWWLPSSIARLARVKASPLSRSGEAR